jgi:acetyl-CoA carboxylase carboxyl transferase subunit beta
MVDMVVHRHDLRAVISRLCRLLMKAPAVIAADALPRLPLPAPAPSTAPA